MQYLEEKNVKLLEDVHYANYELLKEIDRVFKKNNIEYYMVAGTLLGAIRHKDFIPWDDDVDIAITRDMFDLMMKNKVLDQVSDDFSVVYPDEEEFFFDMVIKLNYKNSQLVNPNEETKYYNEKHNKISLDIFVIDKTYKGLKGKIQRFKLKMIYGQAMSKRYTIDYSKYSFSEKMKVKLLAFLGKKKSIQKLYQKYIKVSSKYNKKKLNKLFISNDLLTCIDFIFDADDFKSTIEVPVRDTLLKAPVGYDRYLRISYGDYLQLPPPDKRVPLHINFDEVNVIRREK